MQIAWGETDDDMEVSVSKPTGDVADTGQVTDAGADIEQPVRHPPALPARPPLQRDAMQPIAPPAPAPDPPSLTAVEADTPNSLSLLQLRRIVAEVHRTEPLAYDFEYSDMGPHAEEIDEWFVYQFWQWMRLNSAQRAFEWHWENEGDHSQRGPWEDADNETRTRFVRAAIAGVQSNDAALRSASIGKLVYLVLGRWGDTAMANATGGDSRSAASLSQLQAIKAGVECLASLEGLPVVWEALRSSLELHWYVASHRGVSDKDGNGNGNGPANGHFRSGDAQPQQTNSQEAHDELMNLMTIMYISLQETLNDPDDMSSVYGKLRKCRSIPISPVSFNHGRLTRACAS
jgi:hypothetical protein